jgi:hypothetical protein
MIETSLLQMDKFWDTKQGNLWELRLQKDVLCMIRFYMVFNYVHFFSLAIPFSHFVVQGYVDKYAKG